MASFPSIHVYRAATERGEVTGAVTRNPARCVEDVTGKGRPSGRHVSCVRTGGGYLRLRLPHGFPGTWGPVTGAAPLPSGSRATRCPRSRWTQGTARRPGASGSRSCRCAVKAALLSLNAGRPTSARPSGLVGWPSATAAWPRGSKVPARAWSRGRLNWTRIAPCSSSPPRGRDTALARGPAAEGEAGGGVRGRPDTAWPRWRRPVHAGRGHVGRPLSPKGPRLANRLGAELVAWGRRMTWPGRARDVDWRRRAAACRRSTSGEGPPAGQLDGRVAVVFSRPRLVSRQPLLIQGDGAPLAVRCFRKRKLDVIGSSCATAKISPRRLRLVAANATAMPSVLPPCSRVPPRPRHSDSRWRPPDAIKIA